MKASLVLFSILLAVKCGESNSYQGMADEKTTFPFELSMTLEHDREAFTQGLVYYQDRIIEGTGGENSWISEYDVAMDSYKKKVQLAPEFFGEGITVLNDKLYQLTWKSKVGFVYDARTYEKIGEFSYDFEGWGITHDDQHLIISDGTDKLHYFDTLSLQEVYVKSVIQKNAKVRKLNELEFIDGFIYANQWETNYILKIDTASAEVVRVLDMSYLVRETKRTAPRADVLNGIAYNAKTKELVVTGKYWPRLYVLRFKD